MGVGNAGRGDRTQTKPGKTSTSTAAQNQQPCCPAFLNECTGRVPVSDGGAHSLRAFRAKGAVDGLVNDPSRNIFELALLRECAEGNVGGKVEVGSVPTVDDIQGEFQSFCVFTCRLQGPS